MYRSRAPRSYRRRSSLCCGPRRSRSAPRRKHPRPPSLRLRQLACSLPRRRPGLTTRLRGRRSARSPTLPPTRTQTGSPSLRRTVPAPRRRLRLVPLASSTPNLHSDFYPTERLVDSLARVHEDFRPSLEQQGRRAGLGNLPRRPDPHAQHAQPRAHRRRSIIFFFKLAVPLPCNALKTLVAGLDVRTTLMIKNVPTRMTDVALMAFIDAVSRPLAASRMLAAPR